VARALGAKYARYANTNFDEVSVDWSDVSGQYYQLATKLDAQGRVKGANVPTPKAGGISLDEMQSNHDDDDRPKSYFKRDQFRVDGRLYDNDKDYYFWP